LLGARLDRGSRLTLALCRRRRKPHRRVARFSEAEIAATGAWLRDDHRRKGGPLTLNVAGPRESRAPGIEARAERFVVRLLTRLSRS
jgi:hypothetical protein